MEMFDENTQEVPSTSYLFEEGGRGCRTKKKQVDPVCCPVCSVTLRHNEIDTHLSVELDKLNKITGSKLKSNGKNSPCSSGSSVSSGSTTSDGNKVWATFQKVKNNRQNRLRTKTRKRKADEPNCPVCYREINDDLSLHVDLCLRKSNRFNRPSPANAPTYIDSDQEDIDIESYEEYEWAGQNRIRTTTLLPGGVSSLGQTLQHVEEDEDLNVDGDGEAFGVAQYSERDIILPCDEAAENVALRKAVLGSTVPNQINDSKEDLTNDSGIKTDPVLTVLKHRIKELEERLETKDETYKCLICMERYKTPVISVCCWHVHCEQCWLQTLGAKKLCPQCNMITSPADLRKIYI